MANSKHMQVRNAMLAVLSGLADGNVKRGRAWAMAEQVGEMVKVYLDTSVWEREQMQGQPVDWATRVRCEFLARGTNAANGEDLADAMATAAYGLLMAEPSLGGLCMDLKTIGMSWSTDEADTSIGVVQIVWQADHRTVFNSIAA